MFKRTCIGALALISALIIINLYTFVIQPNWADEDGIYKSSSFVPWLLSFNHYWNDQGDRARIIRSAWGMEEISFFSETVGEPQIGYHRSEEGVFIAAVSVRDRPSLDLRGIMRGYCEIGLSNTGEIGATVTACVPRRDGVVVQLELSRPETVTEISDRVAFRLGNSHWGEYMGAVLEDQDIKLPSFATVSLVLPFDEQGTEPQDVETLFVIPGGVSEQFSSEY